MPQRSRQPDSWHKDSVETTSNAQILLLFAGSQVLIGLCLYFACKYAALKIWYPRLGINAKSLELFQCSIGAWQKMVVSSIGFLWRSLSRRHFRESKQQLKTSCVKRAQSSKYLGDFEKDEFSSWSDWRFHFGQWNLQEQLCIVKNPPRNPPPRRDPNDTFSESVRLHFDSGDTDRKKSKCYTRERSPNWQMFGRWIYDISCHSAIKYSIMWFIGIERENTMAAGNYRSTPEILIDKNKELIKESWLDSVK
jgi:hypothetical protein